MLHDNPKYFSIGFVSIVLMILLGSYFYILIQIVNYDSSRIYNLRFVHEQYRVSLLEEFLDKQYEENSNLLLGDSQTYGYQYPTDYIFSTLLSQKLKQKVINTAFPDESITDNIYTLKYAQNEKMKFNVITFNVNQAHPQLPYFHRLDLNTSIDYKIGIFSYTKMFKEFADNPSPESTADDTFFKYKELKDYFKMDQQQLNIYINALIELIDIAKSISNQVIIYETPHCAIEIKRLKINTEHMKKFRDRVQKVCLEKNVTFLYIDMEKKEFYKDIAHFNTKGHIKISDILYQTIKKQSLNNSQIVF